jgi:hypothetical protein
MKDPIDELQKRIYFRPTVLLTNTVKRAKAGEIPRLFIILEVATRYQLSFVAYCFRCEKKVTAHTLLDAAKLLVALANEYDVEVVHTADSGDHRWKLNQQEKATLLNHIRKSLFNK